MSDAPQNSATGIGTPTAAGIEVTPVPAPAPQSDVGTYLTTRQPVDGLTAEQAKGEIKMLAAHREMMAALTDKGHMGHAAATERYRALQAKAHGATSEEQGEQAADPVDRFEVPEAAEGYLAYMKPASGVAADAELQGIASGLFHRMGADGHTAATLTQVYNMEVDRPLSVERRAEVRERTVAKLTKEWGGQAAFDAKIAGINQFIREQSGEHYGLVQSILFNTSIGVSEFTVRRLAALMERKSNG